MSFLRRIAMYKTGDTVIYPGTGVCRITDVVKQKFMRCEERTYYVMKAVYDNSGTTIYCPVDNADIKLCLYADGEIPHVFTNRSEK